MKKATLILFFFLGINTVYSQTWQPVANGMPGNWGNHNNSTMVTKTYNGEIYIAVSVKNQTNTNRDYNCLQMGWIDLDQVKQFSNSEFLYS